MFLEIVEIFVGIFAILFLLAGILAVFCGAAWFIDKYID